VNTNRLLQVLNNDLKKGVCPAHHIVCLIVDECHRATGKHTLVTAIRAIVSEKGSALRILGLSATPGSQPAMVEEVISNLLCSKVCFFGDNDPEILPHRHERQTDVIVVQATNDASECMHEIREVQYSLLCKLRQNEAFDHCVPERATHYALMQAKKVYEERRTGRPRVQYAPAL
jgi:ERCC4-related helicase